MRLLLLSSSSTLFCWSFRLTLEIKKLYIPNNKRSVWFNRDWWNPYSRNPYPLLMWRQLVFTWPTFGRSSSLVLLLPYVGGRPVDIQTLTSTCFSFYTSVVGLLFGETMTTYTSVTQVYLGGLILYFYSVYFLYRPDPSPLSESPTRKNPFTRLRSMTSCKVGETVSQYQRKLLKITQGWYTISMALLILFVYKIGINLNLRPPFYLLFICVILLSKFTLSLFIEI